MAIRIDHKGKTFQDHAHKQRVASIVQTRSGRLRGFLFQDPDNRLKDNLNDKGEDFIAMEEVELLSPQGSVVDRCPFMAINKHHIEWVMPAAVTLDAAETNGD